MVQLLGNSMMFSLALIAMHMAAAAPAQPNPSIRKAYASCLNGVMQKALGEKTEPAAFDTALSTACAAERAAFRNSLVNYDVAAGTKRAEANTNADLQIDDYLATTREDYRMYLEDGSKPPPAPATAG